MTYYKEKIAKLCFLDVLFSNDNIKTVSGIFLKKSVFENYLPLRSTWKVVITYSLTVNSSHKLWFPCAKY